MTKYFISTALLLNTSIASTTSTTFNVTANVIAACSVSATDLNFGSYTLAELDGQSTITVTCTNGAPYSVALDVGTGSGATFDNRFMTSGANTLEYNLYTENTRTTIWGDGTGPSTLSDNHTGSGIAQNLTVYGRVPAGQTSISGAYADIITATVTY